VHRNSTTDRTLAEALQKAYTARAKLFFDRVRQYALAKQVRRIGQLDAGRLQWDLATLNISPSVFQKIKASDAKLHLIFCHPDILDIDRTFLSYYRNLAALSQKGLAQLLVGRQIRDDERTLVISQLLN